MNGKGTLPGEPAFRETSTPEFKPGSAIGRRVEIRVEDHSVKSPFQGTLVNYILDEDHQGEGWYLVDLDSPVPVFTEPIGKILIFPRGVHASNRRDPQYDSEGRQVSYFYKTPLEDMLLNPGSNIQQVYVYVAIFRDGSTSRDTLRREQILIHPYAEASKPK